MEAYESNPMDEMADVIDQLCDMNLKSGDWRISRPVYEPAARYF